jgi:hypothetical protein
MSQIDIRVENLLKLVKIQKVIGEEEGISSSLDEVPCAGPRLLQEVCALQLGDGP